jgi:GAF domain-containing protein
VTALTGADYRGALDVLRIAHESDDSVPFSRNMLGINHVMKLFFAVGETGASYLVLDSQRRAFSDRDRAVLDLLAPHLALIRQRHRRLADASFETPAAAALLGAREREILDLVASGMTNREIAAALHRARDGAQAPRQRLREARRPKSSAGCRRGHRSRAIRAHRGIAGARLTSLRR